jgi:hypothetical protein
MKMAKRDYRLVCYLGEWQVCSKARRLVEGEPRDVWIYGKERAFFCDVGSEEDIMLMPEPVKRNFFGDRFIHAIDELAPHETRAVKVAGANNPYAAAAAFEALLAHTMPDRRLTLRDGGRIMRQEMGRAVFDDMIKRWVSPDR